jgi:hypothetical protein
MLIDAIEDVGAKTKHSSANGKGAGGKASPRAAAESR